MRVDGSITDVVVVVVVFTLKPILTSFQYLLSLTQGKETNFRGHKLTQNKVENKCIYIKKDSEKVPTLTRKISYRFLKIENQKKTRSRLG